MVDLVVGVAGVDRSRASAAYERGRTTTPRNPRHLGIIAGVRNSVITPVLYYRLCKMVSVPKALF